ncbi:hypothetical protein AVEN_19330-1 [Araneus ventricosus]|uniref:Uncharacterized protein n=1 Tax=Araneus ventricosus TaxID=182803 RepID=A0A4Y2JJD1_ARAVE|nr:hypothetical protein AVEN_19330-1 [Araneus ventricosus]
MVGRDNWTPLSRLSPKRSQNLASPQKKPTASDRPSSLLRGSFSTARDHLARCERVNIILRHHRFCIKFVYANFIPGNQYLLAKVTTTGSLLADWDQHSS